jgi:hypothetical protein
VGGSTSGNATTAPTTPFHFERVCANHQAMGVPTTIKISVVMLANLKVSQTAAQSALENADMQT